MSDTNCLDELSKSSPGAIKVSLVQAPLCLGRVLGGYARRFTCIFIVFIVFVMFCKREALISADISRKIACKPSCELYVPVGVRAV